MRWYQDMVFSSLFLELYDGSGSMEEWVVTELALSTNVFEEKYGERHAAVRRFLEEAQQLL